MINYSTNSKKYFLEMRLSNKMPEQSLIDNGCLSHDEYALIAAEWVVKNECYNDLNKMIPAGTSPTIQLMAETYKDLFTNPKSAKLNCENLLYQFNEHKSIIKDRIQDIDELISRIKVWKLDLCFLNGNYDEGLQYFEEGFNCYKWNGTFDVEVCAIFALCAYFKNDLILAKKLHTQCEELLNLYPDPFLKLFNASMALRVSLHLCDGEMFEHYSNSIKNANHQKYDFRYQLRESSYRAILLDIMGESKNADIYWETSNQICQNSQMPWEKAQYDTIKGLSQYIKGNNILANVCLEKAYEELKQSQFPGHYIAELNLARTVGKIAIYPKTSLLSDEFSKECIKAKNELIQLSIENYGFDNRLYLLGVKFCDQILNSEKINKDDYSQSLVLSIICNYEGHKKVFENISDFRLIDKLFDWSNENELTPESGKAIIKELIGIDPTFENNKFDIKFENSLFYKKPAYKKLIDFMNFSYRSKIQAIESTKSQTELELASRVAHDIRSPLAVLNSLKSELILNQEFEFFYMAIDKINAIANDLLFNKGKNDTKSFQNILILKFLMDQVRLKEIEKNISIQFQIKNESDFNNISDLIVDINEISFSRILSNIFNNAIESKSNSRDLEVRLTLLITNLNIKIFITDNGIGINDDVLLKLGTSRITTKSTGSGLGLSNIKEIIESWNGQFEIQSNINLGTTIHITFPIKTIPNYAKQVILLENDLLTQMNWKSRAKKNNIELDVFQSISELRENLISFNSNATFYLDSELDDGKGEDIAIELFNLGFKEIYMASGHDPEHFKDLKFLKGVISKSPPF